MTLPLVINGQTYDYPETGDVEWGPDATEWAAAVTSGMLQKAGGLFTLLAETDFGASFGLKSLYYKSRTANPADAGQVRLAVADVINWRNAGNSANLSLGIGGTNELYFDGSPVQNVTTFTDTNSIDLTLAARVLTANLRLSANAADAGFINAANTVEATGSVGLQTQVPILVGDSGSGGVAGVAPAPPMGSTTSFLRGDGTWASPPGAAYTFSNTNSIDLVDTLGDVAATLNLSAASADSGYINADLTIESDGLQAQVFIFDGTDAGVVPASGGGDQDKFLKGDGTWGTPAVATADGDTAGIVTTFTPTVQSSVHTVSGAGYTFLTNDGYRTLNIQNSGADRTVILPDAAQNIGRIITAIKTDAGNTVQFAPASGQVLNVYNVTVTGTSSLPLLDTAGSSVTIQCVSATLWRVIDMGAYILGVSLSGSGVYTAGTLFIRKIGAQVFVQVDGATWSTGALERDTAVIVPTELRPSNEHFFASNGATGSGERVWYSILSTGVLRARLSGTGVAGPPYGGTYCGVYFLRA